jgi:S1-C subfamily serine protease
MKRIPVKRSLGLLWLLAVQSGFVAGALGQEPSYLSRLETGLKRLIQACSPYAVGVVGQKRHSPAVAEEPKRSPDAAVQTLVDKRVGTGLLVDASGLVLTRRSVVDGMESLFVVLTGGDTLPATILGYDYEFEIAVLKITPQPLENPFFAHSGSVRSGSWVFILGSSARNLPPVSFGVVRSVLDQNLLRVAAGIWPGGVGAPVFNLNGQVVGIVAARVGWSAASQPAGEECLVLPVPQLLPRVFQIRQEAETISGWVGLSVTQYPSSTQKTVFKVTYLYEGGPAARSGIQLGDEILTINGRPIRDLREMADYIRHLNVGTEVMFEIRRGGEILKKRVIVEKRPPLYVLQEMQFKKKPVQTMLGMVQKVAAPAPGLKNRQEIEQRIRLLEMELDNLRRLLSKKPPR